VSKQRRDFRDALDYAFQAMNDACQKPSPRVPRNLMNERFTVTCPKCHNMIDSHNCATILHTERYQRWTGIWCDGCQNSFTLDASA